MAADKQRALIGGVAGLVPVAAQAFGTQQSGALSGDYQSYSESVPQGQRPLSYTAWQAQGSPPSYQAASFESQSTFVGPTRAGRGR